MSNKNKGNSAGNNTGTSDKLNGRNSNDILDGTALDETVDGKAGDDTVSSGGGDDWVKGGSGNDKLVYTVGLNVGATDLYDGGSGSNILELRMTRDEWMRDDIQADVAGYLAFLDSAAPNAKGKNNSSGYEFTSLGMTARRMQSLEVLVDGVAQDPRDDIIVANNVSRTTLTEHSIVTGNVVANDDVPDLVREVTLVQGPAQGSLSLTSDGSFSYDPGMEFDYLAEGETAQVEFTYQVTDADRDTATAVVSITITGTNDGPVANVDTGTTDENAVLRVDVLANDTDVDASDTHIVTAATIAAGLGVVAIVDNKVEWTPGTDYDYLAVGESATVEINYTMEDNNGAEDSSVLTITVTGSNDGPVANVDTGTTDENASLLVDVLANDTDVDDSDTHTVIAATIVSGLGIAAIVNNQVQWTPGTDYDYLALNESATVEINYTIKDNNGAEASSTLALTVTGSNDGPVANVDTGTTDENGALLVDVLANDTDIDASDTHTVTAATIAAGLGVVAIVDNKVEWSPGADYDYLAVGESAKVEISYTMEDNNGAEDSSTLTITVTGSNDGPVANVDTGTTDENASLLVDVLANDTDVDDSDTHTVIAATIVSGLGIAAVVNNQVQWTPGTDYDYLAVGESAKVEISYTMEDNNGAEDSSTLTITVTGSNDAPTVDYALSRTASEEDTVFTVDLLESAADLDNGAVLSVSDLSVADGKGGWTLNENQLVIDPHHFDELNTGDLETLNVSYKVTDEKGASVDQTLAINIEGFTDAPSLAAIATAGTAVNELQVKIASQPANDERVVLSFTNLPVGARVLDAARADVTGGVNNFAGTHNFFVVLPPEADADFDFGMTVTGFRADGSEIGSTSGAIDFIYDHTQLNNQVTFSSEDQGIWASGDAPMVQWHEYIPIIGGKTKAWNTATKAWEATDEAPWTSGSFSLFSAEVSAEQAKNIALAGAQATLDAAEDTFNDTAYAIDSAVQSTYNAAVSAFGTALTTAGNVFQAATSKAQEVFDTAINGISQVAEDVAIATYNAAVNAAAAVRDGAIATFGWLGGWVSNSAWAVYNEVVNAAAAAKEAALAGVNWSAEKIAEAAQVTYDAAIAAANWASERAIEAANATFAAAENVYNTAKQAVFDAAKAIFDTAQLAFDVASAALDTVQGKTSLDINADMYAEVGLQIDFVLDSGSVDTEVQYDVASTLQHNRTSDVLMITPHLVNQTTGEAVAFETISPNASLKAALLYDVGANLNVLLDSNLVIGNTVIWDISQGEGPINIGTSVTTGGWAEDFENLKDDIEDLAGDLNLEGISVGELVLIDINTAELDQFEVPFIGTLTEDIVSIELGVPTVQTQGKAAAYSPSYYAEGGLVAVDLGEIVGSVMNLLNARLDFSPELREQLNLGSLQEAESFAAAVSLLGEAFLGTLFSALDGQSENTPVFLLDATDETSSSLLHLNLFPDSVMGNTVTADTGKFGFFTSYGESNDLVRVTIDIDQAVAVIVNKIIEAAAATASSGSTVSFLQALPDINPLDLSFGLEEILKAIEAPQSTIDQMTKYFDLNVGFEAADLDVYSAIKFSQEFTLSLDDVEYQVTLEDGAQYLFAANTEGSLVIENASQHDADGNGVVDYQMNMVPKAMFSNDTEIGLEIGYVLDFLKASLAADLMLPLDDLLDIEGLPAIPLNLADVNLGPLLRLQGDLDLASADIFESRFDFNLGSADVDGGFDTVDEQLVTLVGVMPA